MKYSIIVPVYNPPLEFLKLCIDSILNQTYNNYEIIIVDDGSKKEIGKFLDNLISNDHIKVFHNTNHGVSYSRNFGVEKSTGDYISFVDSDDVLNHNFLDIANQILEKNKLDMIVSQVTFNEKLLDSGEYTLYQCASINKELMSYYLSFYNINFKDNNKWVNRGPVARIIKKSFAIENRFDEDVSFAEDVLWNIQLLKKLNNIAILLMPAYYYRKNNGSLTAKYHPSFDNELIPVSQKIKNEIKNENVELSYSALLYEFYRIYLSLDLFHRENKLTIKEKYQKLVRISDNLLSSSRVKDISLKKYKFKHAVLLFLLKHKFYGIILILGSKRK